MPINSRKSPVEAPAPKKHPWLLWGLVGSGLLLILAFVGALGLLVWKVAGKEAPTIAMGDRIGVLRVEGPIYDAESERLIDILDGYQDNSSVKGVLLRINSGGGTVAASEELYSKIANRAEGKPVVAYIAEAGASGA